MMAKFDPIPVTVISGFLGAGKTTLVNHLLRNAGGRRLVVLVNDFGELPIDADLIESVEGDTLNLSNGCACCSMGGDLYNAFVNVLERNPPPEHLIIEASGVADPARIANFARAEPDLSLDAIVSIVDAPKIGELARDARLGPTILQQISCSDLVIINKLDLVGSTIKAEIEKTIKITAPLARILTAQFCDVSVDILLGIWSSRDSQNLPMEMPHSHGDTYGKWSNCFDKPVNRAAFEQALSTMDSSVIRLKGIVQFQDSSRPHTVHWVFGRISIDLLPNSNGLSFTKSKLIAIGLKPEFNNAYLDRQFVNMQRLK